MIRDCKSTPDDLRSTTDDRKLTTVERKATTDERKATTDERKPTTVDRKKSRDFLQASRDECVEYLRARQCLYGFGGNSYNFGLWPSPGGAVGPQPFRSANGTAAEKEVLPFPHLFDHGFDLLF